MSSLQGQPSGTENPLPPGGSFLYTGVMNEDTIKPLGDIVLIKVDPPKKQTESGIIIKEDWKSLPPTGTIVAGDVDRGRGMIPLKKGTRVIFERYSAVMLSEDLRLCKAENILAVIEDAV